MKAVKKIESIGRNAWLAGIGVYNQGLRNTTDKFDRVYVEGNALIQSLIEKGESVESELQGKLRGKVMLDDKINTLKAKLGFYKESRDVQLDKLSSKVDDLIEVVAKLAQQRAEEKAATKVAEKKPAAKTTRSTAAKTTAAKKDTAKSAAQGDAAEKKAPAKPKTTRRTVAKSTSKSTKTTTRRTTKTAAKKDD